MFAQGGADGIQASGESFGIFQWSGSGPPYQHVHHADDEAWHVLSGSLIFQLDEQTVTAVAGGTVFVPAGVAHTYRAEPEESTYLIVLTPRLSALISELQQTPPHDHGLVMQKYQSEIIEPS